MELRTYPLNLNLYGNKFDNNLGYFPFNEYPTFIHLELSPYIILLSLINISLHL